jgi:hypothetical protein
VFGVAMKVFGYGIDMLGCGTKVLGDVTEIENMLFAFCIALKYPDPQRVPIKSCANDF